MKTQKIIFWVSTAIVSLMMLFSAFLYLTNAPDLVKGFSTAGFPLYFIPFLGLAKLAAAVVLLVPKLNTGLKEWAYAGLAFIFTGAIWLHISTSTPFAAPLAFLAILVVSYVMWKKMAEASNKTQAILNTQA